jgi:DNA-binding transcriptional LysR family regulator
MLPCNFNHLYYFYRVAVHQSVSKASKELLIAQSALSTQLKQLEEFLELTLFNRTKGGMALTDKGELVFKHAQHMFETYDAMRREMALAETEVKGPLSIGTVSSVGIYLLPEILTEFHETFPDVQIQLDMRSSSEVIEMLQENAVDVAFIAWDRKYPQLTSHVVMQNHLVLVGNPKHPVSRKRKIAVTDFAENLMIGYEAGTPTRMLIDSQFKEAGIRPTYILESANIATMKHLVLEGMGFAYLPEIAVQNELKAKSLKVIDIEGGRLERPITLYWKERRALTRPAEEFLKFVQKKTGATEDAGA